MLDLLKRRSAAHELMNCSTVAKASILLLSEAGQDDSRQASLLCLPAWRFSPRLEQLAYPEVVQQIASMCRDRLMLNYFACLLDDASCVQDSIYSPRLSNRLQTCSETGSCCSCTSWTTLLARMMMQPSSETAVTAASSPADCQSSCEQFT